MEYYNLLGGSFGLNFVLPTDGNILRDLGITLQEGATFIKSWGRGCG